MTRMMNKYRIGKSVLFENEIYTIKSYNDGAYEFVIEHQGTYSTKTVGANQI